MSSKTPKEVFLMLLSDVRQSVERTGKFYNELLPLLTDTDLKQSIEARLFINTNMLSSIDQCFKLIGEQPVKLSGRLQETFIENFREELGEIQSPVAKHLFILSKLSHLAHLRVGEYTALIAAADVTGHYAVGLLLESVLGEQLAFLERNKRLIKRAIETKISEKKAAA